MRSSLADIRGKRTLLVASTGGHLTQLVRLAPRLGIDDDSVWVTFRNAQSESLLQGRETFFVDYVAPRDIVATFTAAIKAHRLCRDTQAAISTGAAVAAAVLPQMALLRKPAIYLESISRVNGPSLTGRLMRHVPRVGVYAQHASWCQPPWRVGPSVLSTYRAESQGDPRAPKRILVTLGTISPYRFDRLVETVCEYASRNPEVEIVWQLGVTERSDLPGQVHEQLSQEDFSAAIDWADLVIAHSGVGVAINILDRGKTPLLLAREAKFHEHVDDHQSQICAHLSELGLAFDARAALQDDALLAHIADLRTTTAADQPRSTEPVEKQDT